MRTHNHWVNVHDKVEGSTDPHIPAIEMKAYPDKVNVNNKLWCIEYDKRAQMNITEATHQLLS